MINATWRDAINVSLLSYVIKIGGAPAACAIFGITNNAVRGFVHRRGAFLAPANKAKSFSIAHYVTWCREMGYNRAHVVDAGGYVAGVPLIENLKDVSVEDVQRKYLQMLNTRENYGARKVAQPSSVISLATVASLPTIEDAASKAVDANETFNVEAIGVNIEDDVDESIEALEALEGLEDVIAEYEVQSTVEKGVQRAKDRVASLFPNATLFIETHVVPSHKGLVNQCRTPLWGMDESVFAPNSTQRIRYDIRAGKNAPPLLVCGDPTESISEFHCAACIKILGTPSRPRRFVPGSPFSANTRG